MIRKTVAGARQEHPAQAPRRSRLVNTALQRAIRGEVGAFWGKKPNVTVFVHAV
jgi:ribonuclease J